MEHFFHKEIVWLSIFQTVLISVQAYLVISVLHRIRRTPFFQCLDHQHDHFYVHRLSRSNSPFPLFFILHPVYYWLLCVPYKTPFFFSRCPDHLAPYLNIDSLISPLPLGLNGAIVRGTLLHLRYTSGGGIHRRAHVPIRLFMYKSTYFNAELKNRSPSKHRICVAKRLRTPLKLLLFYSRFYLFIYFFQVESFHSTRF